MHKGTFYCVFCVWQGRHRLQDCVEKTKGRRPGLDELQAGAIAFL